jgi:hypothetical protein
LLQCLAPLLHAHVHAGGHGGIHLPEWALAHEQGLGSACVEVHPAEHEAAVGLPPSLQPRDDGSAAMAGPAPSPARLPPTQDGLVPALAVRAILPGPPPYLIPLPGAPPAA